MKRWIIVTVLFSVEERMPKGTGFPIELFYEKVATHLNEFSIGAGEIVVDPPVQIRDTGTFKAVLMLFTSKEVPRIWNADKPL